jgi:DNA (cytosine-5)-methyltransferase 1
MNHASLFTGIGGFDLAAEWMGWENAFQVEIDPFCQKVLTKNFPNVTKYGDIKEFDGTKYRGTIDIISGGFPCQPFSVAGKQRGNSDDRYLWPEMLRVIREVKPTWVVGENVSGIANVFQYESTTELEGKTFYTKEDAETCLNGINERTGENILQVVMDGLQTEGYEVQTFIIPACGVNAPHRRDRIWVVAHSINGTNRTNGRTFCEENRISEIGKQTMESGMFTGTSDNANDPMRIGYGENNEISTGRNGIISTDSNATYSNNRRLQESEQQTTGDKQFSGNVANPNNEGLQGVLFRGKPENKTEKSIAGCIENVSNSEEQGLYGSFAEGKICTGGCGSECNRIQGWEENWIKAATRLCNVDDGIPGRLVRPKGWRVNALKAGGNAIVPQVAFEIFKAIESYGVATC